MLAIIGREPTRFLKADDAPTNWRAFSVVGMALDIAIVTTLISDSDARLGIPDF